MWSLSKVEPKIGSVSFICLKVWFVAQRRSEEKNTEGIDVGSACDYLASRKLRGDIARRMELVLVGRDGGGISEVGDAKVNDPWAGLGEQHVLWGEVSMENPAQMKLFESVEKTEPK